MCRPAGRGRVAVVDLSHVVRDGLETYPGLPGPVISPWMTREASHGRYAPGTEFEISRIEMVGNTGTYVDAPAHRWADLPDLGGVPLDRLADLPGVVVRVPAGTRAVDRLLLAPYEVAGRAVLLHTGWSASFGTADYGGPDASVPDRGRGRVPGRRRGGPGRHRLGQHRRHVAGRGRAAAGARGVARGGHPDRGAPHRAGGAAAGGVPLHGRAAAGGGHGDVSGTGLRGRRLAASLSRLGPPRAQAAAASAQRRRRLGAHARRRSRSAAAGAQRRRRRWRPVSQAATAPAGPCGRGTAGPHPP